MKTKFAFLVCMIFIFVFSNTSHAATSVHVEVSGIDVTDQYKPLMVKGVVFVSSDAFNTTPELRFGYFSGTIDNLIIYESNEKTAYFTVGNMKVKTVSNTIKAKHPPFIKNKMTYVPLRLVAETFGCIVSWDQETKTAHINRKQEETKQAE
ncbi:copper amine oxidase N-terminal domain-containing protein [Paenibacillus terrigena]|uniref:copper amine oxidase N-terminal domain-containing protein n=1 Tax=Paenibacillus terrigena TaxID=369333 RepID=UPI00035E8B82|nr:copper amine oxidase N-terminal domain-containing protein [Paenibacillus terrigena]